MRIAAIFCVALLAYVVVASDSEDGGTAGKESGTKQGYVDNRYRYPPGYYRPQPTPYRPRTTRRRNNIFSNPLYLIIILSILRSSATTKAPDITVAPVTTAAEVTTVEATTAEMTTSKYSGWTPASANCRYLLVREDKTATAAKTDCETRGGALASVGFNNNDPLKRKDIVDTLKAQSVSFWVGATGIGDGTGIGNPTGQTAWFSPSGASPDTNGIDSDNADTTNGPVCGRFPANDAAKLLYEDCNTNKFYYMCEYCGSIA